MSSLLVATRNQGKVLELHAMLADRFDQIFSMRDFPTMPETIEDGVTFQENALKKAREACAFSGMETLADDSGLVVPLLGGEPGVYSARYAGENAGDNENNAKLIAELERLGIIHPPAIFVCCLAYVRPDGFEQTFIGEVHGVITAFPAGDQGFGYDPLFIVNGVGVTMAQLPLEQKNRISHRSLALQQFVAFLKDT